MNIKTVVAQVFSAAIVVLNSVQAFSRLSCSNITSDNPSALDPLHESFLMQPNYDHGDRRSSVLPYVNITRTPLDDRSENKICGHITTNMSPEQINLRSNCPWHYVLNTDNNRIPPTLVEARCNCRGSTSCVGAPSHTRCMPVRYYTRVQRKFAHCVNENGELEPVFKTVPEPIVVGCTCGIQLRHRQSRHHHIYSHI